MLPKKDGKQIAFKCTIELRKLTEEIADGLGESLSEYIRKAVEQRNAQDKPAAKMSRDEFTAINYHAAKYNELEKQTKPTIPELKEKAKEMEKSKMVRSFQK